MGLQTQSIGKSMQYGFAGSFSRQPDMIVNTAPLGGEMPILFGTALKRGENGAVLPMGAGDTANQFVGIAGREVKTAVDYLAQSASMCCAKGEPLSLTVRYMSEWQKIRCLRMLWSADWKRRKMGKILSSW